MSDKRFTAQEMCEMVEIIAPGDVGPMTRTLIARMLVQAADAEEELAHLREEQIRLVAERANDNKEREITGLRRLLKVAENALVTCMDGMCGECHRQHPGETCVNGCYEMLAAKNALAAIREEGGAK